MKSWKKKALFSLLAIAPLVLTACGGEKAEEAPTNQDGHYYDCRSTNSSKFKITSRR